MKVFLRTKPIALVKCIMNATLYRDIPSFSSGGITEHRLNKRQQYKINKDFTLALIDKTLNKGPVNMIMMLPFLVAHFLFQSKSQCKAFHMKLVLFTCKF